MRKPPPGRLLQQRPRRQPLELFFFILFLKFFLENMAHQEDSPWNCFFYSDSKIFPGKKAHQEDTP